MQTSEHINELAAALASAQGAFANAGKDGKNPHLGNRYVTLTSVWDAIRKPLSDNGLAVVQVTDADHDGAVTLITRLVHASGQWIEATYPVIGTEGRGINAAQAMGSALTYARRYSLTSLVGVVADEDDDASQATGTQLQRQSQPQRQPAPAPAATAPTNGNSGKQTPAAFPTPATDGLPFPMTEKGAVDWAMQAAPEVWPVGNDGYIVRDVVKRSFENVRKTGVTGEELGRAWIAKVAAKKDDRAKSEAIRLSDAELDGEERPQF